MGSPSLSTIPSGLTYLWLFWSVRYLRTVAAIGLQSGEQGRDRSTCSTLCHDLCPAVDEHNAAVLDTHIASNNLCLRCA